MATLHLELDIDSDVHPELYVRLASIERGAARQEKLRQLAGTGLIWEIARLHGPAFSEPEGLSASPLGASALDVEERLLPAIDAGSVSDHAPLVPEDVPLLVDVVDEAEIAEAGGAGDEAPALAEPLAEPLAAAEASRHASLQEEPTESAPGARTRSARIKRMKDSGLFQNG